MEESSSSVDNERSELIKKLVTEDEIYGGIHGGLTGVLIAAPILLTPLILELTEVLPEPVRSIARITYNSITYGSCWSGAIYSFLQAIHPEKHR